MKFWFLLLGFLVSLGAMIWVVFMGMVAAVIDGVGNVLTFGTATELASQDAVVAFVVSNIDILLLSSTISALIFLILMVRNTFRSNKKKSKSDG